MDKLLNIVNPRRVIDSDRELLVELLKEDRLRSSERIESQRMRIVELTAKVNDVTSSELREHVSELQANADKMSKHIEVLEQSLRSKDDEVLSLECKLRDMKSRADALQLKVDYAMAKGFAFCSADEMRMFTLTTVEGKSLTEIFSEMYEESKAFEDAVSRFEESRLNAACKCCKP